MVMGQHNVLCVCGCVWRSVWRGMLWRLFVVMWQHKVWCVCVCVWRSVWRGMLLRLFVVMWQYNVWCVCVWRSVWRGMLWMLFWVMRQHNVWRVCVAFSSLYLIHEYTWIQAVPLSNPGCFHFNFRGLHLFLQQITTVLPSTGHFLFGIQLIIFCYVYSIIFSFCFSLRNL